MSKTREELIEAGARAIHAKDLEEYPNMTEVFYGWEVLKEHDREVYLLKSSAALAVFEQAHAPTADEREAVSKALAEILDGQEAMYCSRVWSAWAHGTMKEDDFFLITEDQEAFNEIVDAVMGALRLPVQGEPTGGERCCDHAKCPGGSLCCCADETPQAEPTEAQVWAALDAWVDGDIRKKHPGAVPYWEPKMRAALRAAFAVTEGGQ